MRRPVAGAVGESGSAATHSRIQSRCLAAAGHTWSSSLTWRSKIANTARASSLAPIPNTGPSTSYQNFARSSGGSSAASRRISASASSGASASPERAYSAAAWRVQISRGASRSRLHASST